jgi:membrane-associated phospholipid phosphatase
MRSPRLPLLAGLGTFALLIVVRLAAFDVQAGRTADARVLVGFAGLDRPLWHSFLGALAGLANPQPFAVLALAVVMFAVARRRPRTALAVGLALGLANTTTQLLKPGLAASRSANLPSGHQVYAASWPSGHATASMSLALGGVMVASARWRPWAAAGGAAFTLAVSFSFLALSRHFPSDVAGGYLVAATWSLLMLAALVSVERRWPTRQADRAGFGISRAFVPVAGLVAIAAALCAVVALARPEAVVTYARMHTTFVVGAGIIGALGLTLATALALALRD